jgi:hypothetical protein
MTDRREAGVSCLIRRVIRHDASRGLWSRLRYVNCCDDCDLLRCGIRYGDVSCCYDSGLRRTMNFAWV